MVGEIIKLISDNGIAIVCVAYLIYFQSTTMRDMNDTLMAMTQTLETISGRLEKVEEKIK